MSGPRQLHRPYLDIEATAVGARWRMRCGTCPAVTPPMSKEAAQLALDRHTYETDVGTTMVEESAGRRGRSV